MDLVRLNRYEQLLYEDVIFYKFSGKISYWMSFVFFTITSISLYLDTSFLITNNYCDRCIGYIIHIYFIGCIFHSLVDYIVFILYFIYKNSISVDIAVSKFFNIEDTIYMNNYAFFMSFCTCITPFIGATMFLLKGEPMVICRFMEMTIKLVYYGIMFIMSYYKICCRKFQDTHQTRLLMQKLINKKYNNLNMFNYLCKFREYTNGNYEPQLARRVYVLNLSLQNENKRSDIYRCEDELNIKNCSTCSIYLEEYKKKEELCELECKHMYHYSCINEWICKKPSCPICRRKIKYMDVYELEREIN